MRSSSGQERPTAAARRCATRTRRGTLLGTLTRAKRSVRPSRVAHGDREVERQPGDVGERVRRVDRERGEHREDLGGEVLREPRSRWSSDRSAQRRMRMPCSLELRARRGRGTPGRARSARSWLRVAMRASCSRGERPSALRTARPGLVAALQPGDPHHVELVEVGREDRQELGPLQQRLAGVLGQRQHAGVEVEPGQLAVEVAVVGQLGGGRRGARGRAHRHARRRLRRGAAPARRRAARGSRRRAARRRRGRRRARSAVGWRWRRRRGRRRDTRRVDGRGARRFAERAPGASAPPVRARSPACGSRHHPRR